MYTEGPQRKRPRNQANSPAAADEAVQDAPITYDENYYREDGDAVIRVENVLFKIHRYLLVRDSSVFADMFNMPQGDSATIAATNESPIRLYDQVNDFRALCWYMYVLPMVYMDQTETSTVDLPKIVSLYLISQKYHFESHEKFARKILQTHLRTNILYHSRVSHYFTTCPESRLESLLRIACLSEDSTSRNSASSLTSQIERAWATRLRNTMGSPITYALHVAETLGLRRFIGNLYYLELVSSKMRTKEIEGSTAFVHPTHDLTPSQRLTLYEGGWSLQRYWLKHVNAQIEVFDCPPDEEHSCNELWKSLWPQYIVDLADKSFDPLGFLSDLPEFVTSMNEDCFDEADISCLQFYVRNNIRRLRDSLADHFLGPLPSGSPVPSVS